MSDRSFFERKMSDLGNLSFFAHFPFSLSLICNERMSDKSLNRSFPMSK